MTPSFLRHGAVALCALPFAAHACATCGCALSSDAAMGYATAPGWRASLEYDFINQNQLRNRTSAIPAAQVAAINDAGGDQEVEQGTINRYLTLGLTYSPSASWNVTALVPYIDRTHTTFGAATSDALTPDSTSFARSDGLGDIKLIGAWQGALPTHNLGVQLGVKLPTGRYGGQNVDTGVQVGRAPVRFSQGPASGDALDTSLQPGTGSTDAIVGAYYYQPVSQDFDAFVNGQLQVAVAHALHGPGQDFRPGNYQTLSFGVRYEHDPRVVPQLQVNATHRNRDAGALADNTDTTGTVVYLSPGATVAVGRGLSAFGFVQLPVFRRLDGFQVFPRVTASVGLGYAF